MSVQFIISNSISKTDRSWVKARIAARLVLRRKRNRVFSPRDHRLARILVSDPAVTNQLLDQAVACQCAKVGISYEKMVRATLES